MIQMMKFQNRFRGEDCLVLKRTENLVTLAFPFHEDTPNFYLSIREALELRNKLDEMLDIKLLEGK